MALSANDFSMPQGKLSVDLFPLTASERAAGTTAQQKLDSYVAAWIAESEGKTSIESAQRAWVYYRAFDAVFVRLSANPAEAGKDRFTSFKYQKEQRDAIRAERDAYLEEYIALTDTTDDGDVEGWAVITSLR